ncbi:MAG: hypothetical protein HC880_22380 [Bacteroidia bacterium]|nr:hypothetical protein [Bacteroidia bacterium]
MNLDGIESITVLKDASSAAIYGMRGANGVILLTTKKGRTEKPMVRYSSRFGMQNIHQRRDVLNVDQYRELQNERFANARTFNPPASCTKGRRKMTSSHLLPRLNLRNYLNKQAGPVPDTPDRYQT